MRKKLPDFFLSSPDSNIFAEPRACWIKDRIVGPYRDDGVWVVIEPALLGQKFGLGDKNIMRLILFPRHKGTTLLPVSEWPIHVYVLRAIDEAIFQRGQFSAKEALELAWGALYRTYEEAKLETERHHM